MEVEARSNQQINFFFSLKMLQYNWKKEFIRSKKLDKTYHRRNNFFFFERMTTDITAAVLTLHFSGDANPE